MLVEYYLSDQMTHEVRSRDVECGLIQHVGVSDRNKSIHALYSMIARAGLATGIRTGKTDKCRTCFNAEGPH